jgi:hypothetical protein
VPPLQVRVQAEAMEGARREEERIRARLEEAARIFDQAEKIRRWVIASSGCLSICVLKGSLPAS